MPPRKSRRLEPSPEKRATAELPDAPTQGPTDEPDPNARLALVQLPPELFDAIIENYSTLPTTSYYDTSDIPALNYYERSDALTALSQTCRALRTITLHRLWARLDICRVPEKARMTWYKYTMLALQRKANGIADSPVRHHVRTLTLMFSKSQPDAPLAALWNMLPKLPNLRKIHVINCKTPGFAKSLTDAKLELPNVTTLFIPDSASVFQRICPNAVHIRCVGGSGAPLMSALTDKTERVDGMFEWKDMKVVERFVKKAPNLRTLEIRRPVNNGLGIHSQNTAPAEWAQVIPKLAPLKKLTELILTFPGVDEGAGDAASSAAAQKLVRLSSFVGERRLVVRRVIAPHYQNKHKEDFLHSSTTETFE
ncbi:hypothetical protein DFH07DRAFT_806293 [Mycena maculata]|uniref:Uncharacterized protein n=1 Tax=Mycena maculata TaxID=230809 RepID=A0AAD7JRG0_9AGAR|nr:hypothetical protein DFH07DRAFT_806293 [Mycena maculata]